MFTQERERRRGATVSPHIPRDTVLLALQLLLSGAKQARIYSFLCRMGWFIGLDCSIWSSTRLVLTARVAVHPNETPFLRFRVRWRFVEQGSL